MCSRYELNASPRVLAGRFALEHPPPMPAAEELRPTDLALVIVAGPRAELMGWGLEASWDGRPLINARAESLERRKSFSGLLANRCLVPASGYFEWRRQGRARLKTRIALRGQGLIALRGQGLIAFAGLFDGRLFTIVTCPPAQAIAHVHDRMPVIVAPAAEARWLDASIPVAEVAGLLVPVAGGPLAAEEETPDDAQPDLFGPEGR